MTPLPFLTAPTPVRRVAFDGGAVWVKDEGHAGDRYGGNKVRKLGYLLAEAHDAGITDLVTTGATGSHHVIATAVYARTLGMRTHAVVFPQSPTAHVLENARRIEAVCATVRVVPSWLRGSLSVASRVARILKDTGRLPRVIAAGGSSALGTRGWLDAGIELAGQIRAGDLPSPARVYVPFGTGGTAAGLWAGFAVAGLDVEVVAVRVVTRAIANRVRLEQLARGALGLHGSDVDLGRLRIANELYGAGYGRFDDRVSDAVAVGREAGLPLETTYGGKAFACCLAERDGADVLFVQTVSAVDGASSR